MRVPFLRALSQRDFAILWTGQTVSLFGDGIFGVALTWQALQMSSGAGALGVILVVRAATRVATLLVGGVLADRYPKRLLLLGGEVLQAVSVAALAYLVGSGDVQVWHLVVAGAASGIGSGFFLATASALVPELVEDDYFESANALRASGMLLTYDLLGPAVGGILVAAAGVATALALDALTFLASITALLFIRPRKIPSDAARGTFISDLREGLGYVRRTPWIWITLLAAGTIGNFGAFGMLPVLVPLFVETNLHGGADVLGIVFAGFGAGGVVGALVMGSRRVKLTSAVPAYLGWMTACIALGALAFAPNVVVATLCLAAAGAAGQMSEVRWGTLLQKLVPSHLLGRVTSTDWLVSLSLQPVGIALAAPVAAALGVVGALIAGSLLSTTALAAGMSTRAVRKLEGK